MNKPGLYFSILLLVILGSQTCHAATLKAYVSKFSVSALENREELKTTLQTLLMSRLNSEEIRAVDNQSEAEIQIATSYIVFGDVFSLDAVVKTSSGDFIDRVFVQGDATNELIPSVTTLANRLQRALMKWNPTLTVKALRDPAAPAEVKMPTTGAKKPLPTKPKNVTAANKTAVQKADTSPGSQSSAATVSTATGNEPADDLQQPKPANTSKVPELQNPSVRPFVSQRIPETFNGIARGRHRGAEGTEIFMTGERYLGYYLEGQKLQFLSEIVFEKDEKVIGVDVADLDQNGVPEVYVSILKNGQAASQVYVPENNMLKKTGSDLPYLLRGIALEGNRQRIFVQKINASAAFTGDIFELVKKGDTFTVKNPLQLPLFSTLYNFNKFSGAKGGQFFVVAHPDGYLLVYSKDKKQLWKSREKFGGKESSLCLSATTDPVFPLSAACTTQRLLVTKAGDVIVSRNTGLTTIGAIRTYSRNNVVKFFWNGASLQEKWRSEPSQNYLADFSYDERNNELLLLEVEPLSDQPGERGSRVVIRNLK